MYMYGSGFKLSIILPTLPGPSKQLHSPILCAFPTDSLSNPGSLSWGRGGVKDVCSGGGHWHPSLPRQGFYAHVGE